MFELFSLEIVKAAELHKAICVVIYHYVLNDTNVLTVVSC